LRPISEDNGFSLFGISRQHSPVNEGSISDIRIADIFGGDCQEITDKGFELVRIFEVDLDSRAKNLELDLSLFSLKIGNPLFEGGH